VARRIPRSLGVHKRRRQLGCKSVGMGDFIQADQAMTFRDKSADTTLDGENMYDFKNWWAKKDFDLCDRYKPEHLAEMAYEARQPEIDALKDSLHRVINDARNFCQIGLNNWSEIQRLKAENQQLRADAERYRFLREQNESPVDEDGEDSFYVGVECLFKDGGWVGADLDSVIDAAMKDFSTHKKEEECDS